MHLMSMVVLVVLVPVALTACTALARAATPKNQARKLALQAALLNARSWGAVEDGITALGVPTMLVKSTDAKVKEKLKDVEAKIAEKRDEHVEAEKELNDAADTYASSDDPVSTDSEAFKELKAARGRAGALADEIHDLTSVQVELLRSIGEDVPAPGGQDRPAGNAGDPRGDAWNSSGLLASADIREALASMSTSKAQRGPLHIGEVASRDALVADITGTADMRRGPYLGIIPQLRRMLRVLDLLPTGTMEGNSIPYTEESGSLDTAQETPEGDRKPEAEWTPTDKTADAQTIAHWQKIRKQVLSDFPALQAIIDNRLRYGVERRLENQVLAGNGVGSNLLGILNTAGIGNVPFDGAELAADQVLVGITNILMADALADGIVMNPVDWANVLKKKADAAGQDGHYYSGGPFLGTPQVMWGVPLIPSKAIPQGKALVGDFAIGAMLLIREGVNVLISDADGTDFTQNRLTLLAEMRAAFPVFRPPAFSTVEIVDPTP